MKALTSGECAAWCHQHSYPVGNPDQSGRQAPELGESFKEFRLSYPQDSGQKTALARDVITKLGGGQLLIWVTTWGVWPSSEHMPLFSRLRQGLSENRPLIETPGHLFDSDETDDAVSVLTVALVFYWDCYVFGTACDIAFVSSHDEWTSVFVDPTGDPIDLGSLTFWLSRKGVSPKC